MATDKKDDRTMGFMTVLDTDATTLEWVPPSSFPDLTGYKEVAIDLETHDPNLTTLGPGWARKDGKIVGVAVAAGEDAWYFPFAHAVAPNLDKRMVLRWLQKQMDTPRQRKIMHNAQYDLGWLMAEGIEVKGEIVDTMIVAALVDENRLSYSLDNLAKQYCGMRKDEKLLRAAAKDWALDPKKDMWRLPATYVGTYAEQDARATLALWNVLKRELEAQQLQAIFEIEQPLTEILVKMRMQGVPVDLDKAEQSRKVLRKKVAELKVFIKHKSGVDIEPWAAASVQKVFDSLGLTYEQTETGQPAFNKMFLASHPNEVANAVVQLREMDKADSTFIDSILQHSKGGRIHCEFHQLRSDDGGTVTGRMSCSNPNLQQIPARDPVVKKLIRGIFVPEDGCQWGSFDYSSQEPRLLVHYCAILPENMRHPMIDEMVAQFHAGNADLHQMTADIVGVKRKQAKTINLGIMYGMGVAKMATQLGIDQEEAKNLLAIYHQKVPFVKGIADIASRQAEQHGKVRTVGGRLGRFPLWESRQFGYTKPLPHDEALKEYGPGLRRAFTYKALNKLIQGSAADQTKKAMVDCMREGLQPMLQIHDELCFNVESDAQAAKIREIMENGINLMVPSKVDQDLQSNWGDVD
ncbi:PolA DNA polymerase I - 3'-5' exonuclease and polymerase domains [uncultured Caudovirales phage]|uniref:DNA polymerase n=1 Tax=uncultured Caudovirales phage TaxID=2100421 RepID=A0A6J5R8J7_9CAUD|nr:PolA DNA polymerase I - 3'-5' exonuclease and polymerase domains [uncultured Caudovirales phage]